MTKPKWKTPEERSAALKARNPNYRPTKERRLKGYAKGELEERLTTPENRIRQTPICGAPRSGKSSSGPGTCCMPAGWGTDHVGVGNCKLHGGAAPGYKQKLLVEQAKRNAIIYGAPITIDPHTAILQELARTAGAVSYLQQRIRDLEDDTALAQVTAQGMRPSVLLQMYESERDRLIKVSKTAADMGVAERQITLAEEQGKLLAMVLMAFIRDPELDLTPTQKVRAPALVRKHLLSIEAQATPIPPDEVS